MKFTIFLFGSLVTLLFSCSEAPKKTAVEKPAPVKSEQPLALEKINRPLYSISIPVDMTENKDLNADASLAYMNAATNEFIIVIDEPKEEIIKALKDAETYSVGLGFIENYRNASIERFMETVSLDKPGIKGSLRSSSGQLLTYQAEGKITDVPEDFSYFIAFSESRTHGYTIMAWTLKRNAAAYEHIADEMMKSFKAK